MDKWIYCPIQAATTYQSGACSGSPPLINSPMCGSMINIPPVLLPTVVYCCQIVDEKVVSGGGDGLVKVWKSQSGLLQCTLTGHTQEVVSQPWVYATLHTCIE